MRLWLQKKTWHCMSVMVEASRKLLSGLTSSSPTITSWSTKFSSGCWGKDKGKVPGWGVPKECSSFLSSSPILLSYQAVENSRACCERAELVISVSPVPSFLWKLLVRRGYCDLSPTVETKVEECDVYILAVAVHYIHVFDHCLCVLAWWLELRKLLSAWQVGLQLPTEDICITTVLFPFFKLHTWAS